MWHLLVHCSLVSSHPHPLTPGFLEHLRNLVSLQQLSFIFFLKFRIPPRVEGYHVFDKWHVAFYGTMIGRLRRILDLGHIPLQGNHVFIPYVWSVRRGATPVPHSVVSLLSQRKSHVQCSSHCSVVHWIIVCLLFTKTFPLIFEGEDGISLAIMRFHFLILLWKYLWKWNTHIAFLKVRSELDAVTHPFT